MKRKLLVEAESEVHQTIYQGDIILLHNTIEYILCIISYVYNNNRIVGNIISNLKESKRYGRGDTIEFRKSNILDILLQIQ